MNRIEGHIKNIGRYGVHRLVSVSCGREVILKTLTLELDDYYQIGTKVYVLFKETDVLLTRIAGSSTSAANHIPGIISLVTRGRFLSSLSANSPIGIIESMTLTDIVDTLNFEEGQNISMIIRASDMALALH